MSARKGMGGHHSAKAKSIVWLTPRHIIKTLGPFDLDPCAAPEPRPWPTAAHHYVEANDGLSLPWHGRIWLNPPYGRQTGRWLARLADHGTGTALIFARTETNMFFENGWGRADAMLFLRGRLHFCRPDGMAAGDAGAPSVMIAYGGEDAERLYDSARTDAIPGHFVALQRRFYLLLLGEEALRADNAAGEPTWRWLVEYALESAGGEADLQAIYRAVEGHAKTHRNRHWREKVRQVVQGNGFRRVRRGHYRLMDEHKAATAV